jgi:dipeptidyl aminopeptidase/acylaminoacyl peptidase
LYNLGDRAINQLQWSPDSTGVLLGSDQVARGNTVRPSGYLATNNDVSWSGPKGSSLLATTRTADLVKRDSRTGARTDISFLDEHRRSTYHPAGKAVVSIGRDVNPEGDIDDLGVFMASNIGTEPKLLITDSSDAELSDIAFSASGNLLFFLARHNNPGGIESHVHEYNMSTGELSEAESFVEELSTLTVSAVDESVAARIGACDKSTPTDILFSQRNEPFRRLRVEVPSVGNGWLQPIGWLPGNRLVYLTRLAGCEGPAGLAVADLESRTVSLIASNVSIAATRTVHAIPEELALPLDLQVEA